MSWPVGWRSKEEAERILKENCPDHSIVSWAFRFLASLDGMITILSGMYTLEQMKDNIGTMGKITPLKYRIAYLRSHIMSISKILFPSALYLHIPCFADFSFKLPYCTVSIELSGILLVLEYKSRYLKVIGLKNAIDNSFSTFSSGCSGGLYEKLNRFK